MKAPSRAAVAARSRQSALSFATAALLAAGAAALLTMNNVHAQVATGSTGIDASGSYRQEVQACQSGRTQQDRETCLREARNAQAERERGSLDANAQLKTNATARCNVLRGEEKAACQARVLGYGSTSGSVAGGGVLREVETVVMPPDVGSITVEPKTSSGPVVLVPANQ